MFKRRKKLGVVPYLQYFMVYTFILIFKNITVYYMNVIDERVAEKVQRKPQ